MGEQNDDDSGTRAAAVKMTIEGKEHDDCLLSLKIVLTDKRDSCMKWEENTNNIKYLWGVFLHDGLSEMPLCDMLSRFCTGKSQTLKKEFHLR